jgi:hypothetical protein
VRKIIDTTEAFGQGQEQGLLKPVVKGIKASSRIAQAKTS